MVALTTDHKPSQTQDPQYHYRRDPKHSPRHTAKPALNATLKQLMAEVVAAAPHSLDRQRCFHESYNLVMHSKNLWRDYYAIEHGYYNDAVNDMWAECFSHPESYDPQLKEAITWLNDALKRALRRHRDRNRRDQKRHISTWTNEDGDVTDATDILEARPDAYEAFQKILKPVLLWVHADPDGSLRQRIFCKRPEINAQALLLRRLPPQSKTWPEISQEFGLTGKDAKALPQWYSRYCYPYLRAFGAQNDLLHHHPVDK